MRVFLITWLSLLTSYVSAQTNSANPHVICVNSTEPYQVDYTENGGAGTTGSTYAWTMLTAGFTGTITTNQGPGSSSNRIVINWGTTPPGNYVLQVIETNGGCPGTPIQLTIQLTPQVTPTFTQLGPFCQNSTAPSLPTTSTNGIVGTWLPATINTSTPGTTTYTFTPNPNQCALPTTMDITITPEVTPNFAAIGPLCQNSTAPTLATTSPNGVSGTWSPSSINTSTPGTVAYTFTPTPGQCALPQTLSVTVDPLLTPNFTPVGPLCQNSTPPILPTTSLNGVTGTWLPATVNTTSSGSTTYTFTPSVGQCAQPTTMTIVVDTQITPNFAPVAPICQGGTAPVLATTSINGIVGTWSPSVIDVNTPGTANYVFTPNSGQCAIPFTLPVTINALPIVNAGPDETICEGDVVTLTASGASTYTWSPASGLTPTTGAIVSANPTSTTTYTVTGTDANGCVDSDDVIVTVNPLPVTSPIFHN